MAGNKTADRRNPDVQAHAFISGRVQGIFYRASAKAEAVKRGLCGWVMNTPEGKVELVVQGPKSDVEDFLDWCRSGPMLADVQHVDVSWEAPEGRLDGFEIRNHLSGTFCAAKNLFIRRPSH